LAIGSAANDVDIAPVPARENHLLFSAAEEYSCYADDDYQVDRKGAAVSDVSYAAGYAGRDRDREPQPNGGER